MLSLLLHNTQIRSIVNGVLLSTAFSLSASVSAWTSATSLRTISTKNQSIIYRSVLVVPVLPIVTTRRKLMSPSRMNYRYLTKRSRGQLLLSSSSDSPSNTSSCTRTTGSTDNFEDVIPKDVVTTTTSTGSTGSTVTVDDTNYRKSLLHEKLLELDCFTDEIDVRNFEYVVEQSMIDPTLSILVPIREDCDMHSSNIENDTGSNVNNRISGMQKYGKSTIKTCQTFYYPKSNSNLKNSGSPPPPQQQQQQQQQQQLDPQQHYANSYMTLKIAAARTARQIEFLYQRHKAQQTQWIRNHDIPSQMSTTLISDPSSRTTTTVFEDDDNNDDESTVRSDATNVPVCSSSYFPFVVVLDNLRSAQNVGSIYRTADATKCQQVITIGITPNPCNGNGIHKVQKSSLGAELFVPTQHFTNATMALQYIYQSYPSYEIVCVETTSESIPYTDLQYNPTTASNSRSTGSEGMVFIFGNEVTGVDVSFYLSQMTKLSQNQTPVPINAVDDHSDDDGCNVFVVDDSVSMKIVNDPQQSPATTTPPQKVLRIVEIPMYGTKNSLNVAVCVSIILYEMIRQYHRVTVAK